ncbi:MAG TPA: hypothetical protein VII39_12995, partial [Bradyrhizobium sp.]
MSEPPHLSLAARAHILAQRVHGFCAITLTPMLDCAGFDEFNKAPTDHAGCDDGVVPVICPTSQMVSQDASGIMPAVVGYF